jgi:hypothetical protein
MNQTGNEALANLNAVLRSLPPDMLAKATFGLPSTSTSPINYYDLEAQAKITVPEITPLIRMIPRVPGVGGTATNWDSVTAINTANLPMGVPSGTRAGVMDVNTTRNTATYVTVGLEASADWQAEWAAQGFDNIRALMALNLLKAARIGEEQLVVGGNGTNALGTSTTVTQTGAITGGTLAAATYHVRAVALTLAGYKRASLTLGIPVTQAVVSGDGGTTTTMNAGSSIVSADGTATVASGSTGRIDCSWVAVPGAVAYALFWGADATTNCNLGAIVTVNAYTITATVTAPSVGTGFAGAVGANFATDHSANPYVFNGLISFITKSGSGSYVASLDNVQLVTDDAGGCAQINTALQAFWDTSRLSPDYMIMQSQQCVDLNNLIVKNGGAPLFRNVMDIGAGGLAGLVGGSSVAGYINKTALGGGKVIKIILHPDAPPGMILFFTETIPYATANFSNILQLKAVREWFQTEWPMTTPKYQYGVYCNEVLQCYFPPAFGMIYNIKPGIA